MFNFFPFSLLKIWRPITTIFNILKVRWDIRTFVKFACTCVIRYGPEILVQCKINPARSWIKFFMKGCLKIASIVLHTRLVYLMKLGVCVQRTITDLSSLIHKRVQELFYRALCWGCFQIMITNTLVRCQFNIYLQ